MINNHSFANCKISSSVLSSIFVIFGIVVVVVCFTKSFCVDNKLVGKDEFKIDDNVDVVDVKLFELYEFKVEDVDDEEEDELKAPNWRALASKGSFG